ncbi:MAG: hypothetical protein JWM85_1374, partial [Acidimicrobiaceae bacterium]|nr:hypothetical protein [Acidimicrobiaceae bacterium]
MERESTKHGTRLDEELSRETASIVKGAPVPSESREDRRQEDPAEGLDPATVTRPDVPERSPVGEAEADARVELARAITAAQFPADRR